MRRIDITDVRALEDTHPMLTTRDADDYFEQEGIDGEALIVLSAMLVANLPVGMDERDAPGAARLLRMMLLLDDDFNETLGSTYITAITLGWELHKRAEQREEADVIGDQLREVREARGFSLGEVERRSEGKITDGGLSRIEKGQREPLLGTLVTLSEVLGATILIQRGEVKIRWTKKVVRPAKNRRK